MKIQKTLGYFGSDKGSSLLALIFFILIEYMFFFSFLFLNSNYKLLHFMIMFESGVGGLIACNNFFKNKKEIIVDRQKWRRMNEKDLCELR